MMQWSEPDERYRITNAAARFEQGEGECILTWNWPQDVNYVYIYSFEDGAGLSPDRVDPRQLKLFTREEYKVKSGYRMRVDFTGPHYYRIFPCVTREGGLTVLMQLDSSNLARVSGGRAKIRYSIKYGNPWFGKYKSVRIRLFCEIPVPREALCYVKKEGAAPRNKEDGTVYPFMNDFPPGRTELPPIEVGRSEYIRLFFSDGPAFGERFELLQE
ncbi:hypothetical protein [Paenibacillus sp. J2TS4]|uniref:hypothetical protein n=1 Tax=Paenibacillus sp. J2TS4 TaxID=2807194 RepID=UPI001B123A53|nr:hypothetical protein [Paenibacillus sp. J2TS4]GIP32009.1 hypothetical protein J2TS4_12190 [Paenibacillus sp. J2TS4]